MREQSVKFQLLFPRQPEESSCFHCVKAGQFPKVAQTRSGKVPGTAALPTGGSSLGSCSLQDLTMPLCCSSFFLHVSNIKVNTEPAALEDSSFLSIEDSSVLH